MILWVCVYISMSLQKLSVAWVVFNQFIPVNNEPSGLGTVTVFSCLVEGKPQTINFERLFLTVFFLLNQTYSRVLETVTYERKGIFLKMVAALFVDLFLVDSVFFHSGEITFL